MNAILPTRLTVDDFLSWSMDQERGRYELEGGKVIVMTPQNLDHVKTKTRVCNALIAAIASSNLPFCALPDGPTIRISDNRAYEPDALVASLPEPSGNSLEIQNPIIVVEVLSSTPSSVRRDLTTKLGGYALVRSIEHYIVIDPVDRTVFRFHRQGALLAAVEELTEGMLRLDPPGLEIAVEDMLMPAA